MENMILTPVAVDELVDRIACEVIARINRPEKIEPLPDRISLHECSLITGSSKSKLYKQTMLNEIPFAKYGRRLIFSRKAIIEWMEKNTISAPAAGDVMENTLARSAKKYLKK